MNVILKQLVTRIKQRAYLDTDEEIGNWIELYCLEEKRSLCVLHGHSMFSVYNLSNRDRGGQSDWGLNKCSRCGYEEPWQYDF